MTGFDSTTVHAITEPSSANTWVIPSLRPITPGYWFIVFLVVVDGAALGRPAGRFFRWPLGAGGLASRRHLVKGTTHGSGAAPGGRWLPGSRPPGGPRRASALDGGR